MKRLLAVSLLVFTLPVLRPLSAASGQAAGSPAADEIKAVLEAQKAAWNRADIEGFMATYWNSDSLTFQSGKVRTHGWANVLARYKRTYAADNMGQLDFTDLAVTMLAADAAYVLGRFKLVMKDATSEGVFTLILRHTKDGWRIIHDHTST